MASAQLTESEDIYKFKVKLNIPRGATRVLEIPGTTSLANFAEAITAAYGFDMDHAYGFFNNLKCIYDSTEAYTLFHDEGMPTDPNDQSVSNNYIHNVFVPAKKMIFYYDYGDEWHFLVECRGTKNPEPGVVYPRVVERKGNAPPQYRYD